MTTKITETGTNQYQLEHFDASGEQEHQPWNVAIRADQDINVVAQDMYDNWQQHDNPNYRVPTDTERLEEASADKVRELRAACQSAIQSGFASDALGAVHTYPCKQGNGYFDQSNLSASVTESLLPNLPTNWSKKFWCADGSGNWQMRPHSAAQIQQVGQAGSLHVSTNIELCDQKVREVEIIAADASRTIDQRITDIKAVTW